MALKVKRRPSAKASVPRAEIGYLHGSSHPLGAAVQPGGVNFCVFAKDAAGMELLFFDAPGDATPSKGISFHPVYNRTDYYWHIFVPGVHAGQIYAYRATGPMDPARGLRFDPNKILLDPYGKALIAPSGYTRRMPFSREEAVARSMKSVVADPSQFDWEGDEPLRRPFDRTVIYEMHVGGFTKHPNSGVSAEKRGTYAGLVEKIPYLKELGVTAVELLPVFHFDADDASDGLANYWGYSPISFFVPHAGYSTTRDPLGVLDEFRQMVKELHRAGIEVILDSVFNHTAEGSDCGPTFCYRGLANDVYYLLEADRARYANFAGTGNTLNANHPIVRRMILDSLHYWVHEMHVDGFRFDLASVLARDRSGLPLMDPPVLWDIETDPLLAGVKLIAEPWDAGGLYQVGTFIGDRWEEWNGKFRDDTRSFLKGDSGTVSNFASRMLGSPDLYGHKEREVEQSINFICCHDGFTLNDLVSYNAKHNDDNGEQNRDGYNNNLSWNCGVEGPTELPEIERLRNRRVKTFLTANFLALGTPMLLMGDEVRRTQLGNNNAYCQDNEISWFDWDLVAKHADVHRFARLLIKSRIDRPMKPEAASLTLNQFLQESRVQWHGVKLNQPDWGNDSHSIAVTGWNHQNSIAAHIIFNAYREPLEFELPELESKFSGWQRWIDTSLDSPNDITPPREAPPFHASTYKVAPYSAVVLLAFVRR